MNTVQLSTHSLVRTVPGVFSGCLLTIALLLTTGCGPSSVMMNSKTDGPIVIQQSAYTASGCRANLASEADRLGITLRATDVKGSLFGDALLWPFVKGYVCLGSDQNIPLGITGHPYLYQG
ncbi:MAG: hypothetical protein U0172_04210 [Nitrospiraceae bacterium]